MTDMGSAVELGLTQQTPQRKTRTGCIRCKRRRVKCDEGQPQCQRCIKINVQCPGYDPPKTRLFGLSVNECFTSDFEKLCFESFVVHGTHELIEFQPSVRNFWQSVVPQLGQVYPAIRHATIAISILVEPLIRQRQAFELSVQDNTATAIWHFNQAIRSFLDANSVFRIEARLTSCILFHALTRHLDHIPAGAAHVRAADFFLKDHERLVLSGSEMHSEFISLRFASLIRQYILDASTYLDDFQFTNLDCGNRFEMFRDYALQTPSEPTIPSMHETLTILVKYAIGSYLRDFSDPPLIASVNSALDEFQLAVARIDNSVEGPTESTMYLKMHHCAAYVFAHAVRANEASFDTHTLRFLQICDLAEQLHLRNVDPFSISLGFIPPLFFTATKCRDQSIRSRALRLLHALHRGENAWTSCIANTIASFVVHHEQQHSGSRISLFHASYSNAKGVLEVTFDVVDGYTELPNRYTKTFLMEPAVGTCPTFDRGVLQNRVLWAAGYSGATIAMRNIPCHCKRISSSK